MDATNNASLGATIRNARMARQLSVKELIKQSHVSEQFVHSLENDRYMQLPAKIYSMSLAEDVLESLNFKVEERHKLLQVFELELNRVEQEKYQLLKDENYTPKVSKFSFDGLTQSSKLVNPPSASQQNPRAELKQIVTETSDGAPIQEKADSNFLIKLLWLGMTSIVLLVIFVLLWFFVIQPKGLALEKLENEALERRFQVFSLYGHPQTFEMAEGDQLRIFFSNRIISLSLKTITDQELSFTGSTGTHYLFELHARHFVNLDDDQENDILLKYQKRSGELAVVFVENLLFNEAQVNYEQIWNNQEHVLIGHNYTLLENQINVPIIVYVKAVTLPVHLSYNIDGRRQNTVNLATGASIVISADEHLELQIGNYLSSALIINNIPINLFWEEYNRYSTTKIIKWLANYDNETLFDLVITDYVN